MKKYYAEVEEWKIEDNIYEARPILKFVDGAGYTRRHIGMPRQITPFNEDGPFTVYLNKNTGYMCELYDILRKWFFFLLFLAISPFLFLIANIFFSIPIDFIDNSIVAQVIASATIALLWCVVLLLFVLNNHQRKYKKQNGFNGKRDGKKYDIDALIIGHDIVITNYRNGKNLVFPIYKYTYNDSEYYYRSCYPCKAQYYGSPTGVVISDNYEPSKLIINERKGLVIDKNVKAANRFNAYIYLIGICIIALAVILSCY